MSVTTEVLSSIHARSPAIVSCTADLSSTVSDDEIVDITWSRDGAQLRNNSEMLIVSANLAVNKYQSNITIHVLEAADDGLYSCLVRLMSQSSNQLMLQDTSSIYLNVEGICS